MEQELKKSFQEKPEASIKEVVKATIEKAKKEVEDFEKENQILLTEYEKPSASLAIVRSDKKITECYLLGDTETIIGYKDGTIEEVENPNQKAVQRNDNDVIRRMAEIAKDKGCNVVDMMKKQEIQEMLQKNREKKNQEVEGGYWIASMTREAVEHGVYSKNHTSN